MGEVERNREKEGQTSATYSVSGGPKMNSGESEANCISRGKEAALHWGGTGTGELCSFHLERTRLT
jgi:hypothetical protein